MVVTNNLFYGFHFAKNGVHAGFPNSSTADTGQYPGLLAGKVSCAHRRHGPGAGGADKLCAHITDGLAGFLVVQGNHKYGAGQATGLVGGVGAVPFLPADVKAAPQISGHCHKPAVRSGHRHIGKRSFLRKYNVHSVIVVVVSSH